MPDESLDTGNGGLGPYGRRRPRQIVVVKGDVGPGVVDISVTPRTATLCSASTSRAAVDGDRATVRRLANRSGLARELSTGSQVGGSMPVSSPRYAEMWASVASARCAMMS